MTSANARRVERFYLPVCLIVQAALLFWRLDLLPIWGDEQFTLDTAVQPLAQIAAIVRSDIHPPLYYFLVHYWLELPWSADLIVKARAFSGVWALGSTVMFHRLWTLAGSRWRFLLLWTLSPCLILYGRMGRSYTLQLFLGSLALYWGAALLREPRRRGALLMYSLAGALLFYTHYLPALAIVGAVQLSLLYRLIRKRDTWVAATAPVAIMLSLYAPWLINIGSTVERALHAGSYTVTPNPFVEQAIRLIYLGVSFTVGETAPVWAIAAAAILVGWTARSAAGLPAGFSAPVILLTAAIGYLGATRWVSFAFIPARLLFLLPFYLNLFTKRAWTAVALACLSVIALFNYYHQQNFLNKGYLLPFAQIADIIQQRSAGRPAQLIVEAPGLNVSPLTRRLNLDATAHPEIIWVLSARDHRTPPPGTREVWHGDFVPYSDLDRTAMRLLNWTTLPTHVLQLTEYHAQ